MKKLNGLLGLTFAALAVSALSSCSNEPAMPADSTSVPTSFVRTPDITAWSGNHTFGNPTSKSRAGEKIEAVAPKPVTADEMAAVRMKINAIDTHFNGNYSGDVEGVTLFNGFSHFNTEWLKNGDDFYAVNILNGSFSYSPLDYLGKTDIRFWHQELAYSVSQETYNNGNYTALPYVEDFLNYAQYNPQIHIESVIKDISFNEYKYFINATNPLYLADRNNYNKFGNYPAFRYFTIDGMESDEDYEYAYIAAYSQRCSEGNPGSPSMEKGDNVYDRVIRIAKKKPAPVVEEPVPGLAKDQVEINIAINDPHNGTDLVSKLSMHVRYPKDIEVVIPVPERVYCDQDDLIIAQTNDPGNFVYGGEHNSVSYTIAGQTVTVNVDFVAAADDELTAARGGYIRIYTEGINDRVIDYLEEMYADGINFEIATYFKPAETDFFQLQFDYLSHSFINFDWNSTADRFIPERYIMGFNSIAGQPNPGDSYLWIVGDEHIGEGYYTYPARMTDQARYFHTATQGLHKNGSRFNWIFVNKSLEGSAEPTENVMPAPAWPFNNANRHQSIKVDDNDNFTF